jgi:hypothetical protein
VYWGGGYNPTTEQITEGPIVIHVPTALAASELCIMRSTLPGRQSTRTAATST